MKALARDVLMNSHAWCGMRKRKREGHQAMSERQYKHFTQRAWLGRCVSLMLAVFFVASAAADEASDVDKLLRNGHHSQALIKADNFLAQNPDDAKMRFLKGVILTEQNKKPEAIAVFLKLTEDFPQLPEPYNNLAVLYAGSGQYGKAQAMLEAAIRINPTYATARQNLADVSTRLAKKSSGKTVDGQVAKDASQSITHKVKGGESLGQIAQEFRPDGVSLDQVLVALYRANPDAFFEENMHRLRTGRMLSIPDAETVRQINAAEAKGIVSAHTTDFHQYRHQLAGGVASSRAERQAEVSQREADGRIQFDVAEPSAAAAPSMDKLKLTAADTVNGASADAAELMAMKKALEESQARVRQLEKNIEDLQRILQVKSETEAAAVGAVGNLPRQSTKEGDATVTSLAVKAVLPEKPPSASPAASTSFIDSMRPHAIWLGLCGVLLAGLTIFVFFGGRNMLPGVRSDKSSDRRMSHQDRRDPRNRLSVENTQAGKFENTYLENTEHRTPD